MRSVPLSLLDTAEPAVRGVLGALTTDTTAPTPIQLNVLRALVERSRGISMETAELAALPPLGPEELAAELIDPAHRLALGHLMVMLAFTAHPLPVDVERNVERYLAALEVSAPIMTAARHLADGNVPLLYADIRRRYWFRARTLDRMRHGQLGEMVRSSLAHRGVAPDRRIAAKWQSLGEHPEGSWGHETFRFYRTHGFALPGERHGIDETAARHDFMHILADYPPTPEGEIDVFSFIASTMRDPRGLTLVAFALCLFQNASIKHVGAKRVAIAQADALAVAGAPERMADALFRGTRCAIDVTSDADVDPFALADVPVVDVRERFGVRPKATPGPGAF